MSAQRNGSQQSPRILHREDGARIAYHVSAGDAPTVVFLGGFASDMSGTKARHLEDFCRARGQAYVRFDYRGHGQSSGRFAEGTIGAWRDDALGVVRECTSGPLVLVGSSMGAWIMLLVALALPERVRGLVGVAAAPDFTEELVWQRLTPELRAELLREGSLEVPSEYQDESCVITRELVEEGRRHLLLGASIPVRCPVRLLHGLDDRDVPWQTSQRLMTALRAEDVTLTLVKGGEHRLSSPGDLALLSRSLTALLDAL